MAALGTAPGFEVRHDQAGSAGAVTVLRGRLVEWHWVAHVPTDWRAMTTEEVMIAGPGPRRRVVAAGETVCLPEHHVQDLGNRDADGAVSAQAYSPPLRAPHSYRAAGCGLRPRGGPVHGGARRGPTRTAGQSNARDVGLIPDGEAEAGGSPRPMKAPTTDRPAQHRSRFGAVMNSRSLKDAFAAQVARTPEAPAVVSDMTGLTYRELDERSDVLAQRLRELGAGPETPVAVLLERSPELVAVTLAIVKTGAFYVPLHSAYPADRLQRIVDHLGGPLLVTDSVSQERGLPTGSRALLQVGDEPRGPVAAPVAVPVEADDLAYVLFTSGSTGEPKGVAVTHRDVLGLASARSWDGGAHERVLMVSPYAFGMSTYELWVPLLRGGRIIVPPPGELDALTLGAQITRHGATVVHLTAGLFRVVAEESPTILAPLQEVMTGGDVIAPDAVAKVLKTCPRLVVRAMYGATETTLFTTDHAITAPYRPGSVVPTGTPMDGMRVHLLDEQLRPVAHGEPGELYVAGTGVARGYFGRPDLTAERFVPDPFGQPGERMYRTGDIGRWNDEGLLELIGRADHQVKIRGFRVELAEVESAMAAHPAVAHAVAVAVETTPGTKRIVGYAVPAGDELNPVELRDRLGATLPDFMLPSAIAILDRLPLTANGKIDRSALPQPDFGAPSVAEPAPTSVTDQLRGIFADVLNQAAVGADDSFFDMFGSSMEAIRLTLRIAEELGVRVTIPDLYDFPTPAQLAGLITDKGQQADAA